MADLPLRKIVTAGVLSAVAIVLGVTHLGLIPWFSGAAITIMHIPVVIGAILEGPVVGVIIGLIFGIFSLIQAAVAPTGPIDVAFTNPIVSVVPRVFIGLAAYAVFRAIRGTSEKPAAFRFSIATIAAGLAGSLVNTGLVLSALAVMKFITWEVVGAVALANGLPEAAVGAVITFAVVASWKRIPKNGGKSDLSREEET